MDNKVADNSIFDELVTEITSDERKRMLKRMKPQTLKSQEQKKSDTPNVQAEDELSYKFRQQSFFKQILYWITAKITNSSVEDVFNKALINSEARSIDKEYPGLVDFKRKILCTDFYEKIVQLKHSADFFEPFLHEYEEKRGAFFVSLGDLIMPEIREQIETGADPYQYTFDKVITKEMRTSLVHKMDSILSEIPQEKRSEMFVCVRGIEWLLQLSKLPFSKLLAKFAVAHDSGIKEGLFNQVKGDWGDFTRILCNYTPVPDEALNVLCKFKEQQDKNGYKSLDSEAESEVNFISLSGAQLAVIRMFIQTIPLKRISRLIFENYQYTPDSFGGGEDWYQLYKEKWRSMFDKRWAKWNRDYQKEKLREKLQANFEMNTFPLFPYRPWEKLWGGQPFRYELTLGFLNAVFKKFYQKYADVLKTTALEGDFALKDNQVEFTDMVNSLAKINEDLEILANQLTASGEYGILFLRHMDEVRTEKNVELISAAMDEIEQDVSQIVNLFGKTCRNLTNLLEGMLSKRITAYYGPLTNLMRIRGRENKIYREKLYQASEIVENVYEMLRDIEPLDMFVVNE